MIKSVKKGKQTKRGAEKGDTNRFQVVDMMVFSGAVEEKDGKEKSCGNKIAIEKKKRRGGELEGVLDDRCGETPESGV